MAPTILTVTLWTLFSFLCGSLPLSLWTGRLLAKKDIRSVGDGNPGAINALKSGGWKVGLLALILDISKSAALVGLAYQIWGWRGWEIVPVALAPLFGSALSPFLKFRGGKSLAVSLGIWIGLTLWEAPVFILTSLTLAYLIQTVSGWAVVVSTLSIVLYLVLRSGEVSLWVILGIQTIVLFWKHRVDLAQPPRLRKWLTRK
jgi:glycerol-3-phosphate acyltransferase PlsY